MEETKVNHLALQCPVCSVITLQPVQTSCGYLFCKRCVIGVALSAVNGSSVPKDEIEQHVPVMLRHTVADVRCGTECNGEMCSESGASGPKHLLKICSNTIAGKDISEATVLPWVPKWRVFLKRKKAKRHGLVRQCTRILVAIKCA